MSLFEMENYDSNEIGNEFFNDLPEVKLGDIFKLGNHYLMCGDSTNEEDVAKLMHGERADIMFTSPPYNTQQGEKFEARGNARNKPGNYYANSKEGVYGECADNLTDEEYTDLLSKSTQIALKYCDDVLLNIGILKGSKHGIIRLLKNFEDNFLDILVWNKSSSFPIAFTSQLGAVSHRCELIFCFNQTGNRKFTHPQWSIGTQINRIDTSNASGNEFAKLHGATFPVEFANKIVKDYTATSCLDLFGGTGTTLIACEQLKRKCFMMELDPYYCSIILRRWQLYTQKDFEKLT